MPSFSGEEIEFEVYCSCGAGLCNQSRTEERCGKSRRLIVEPCEKCLQDSYQTGFEKGNTES